MTSRTTSVQIPLYEEDENLWLLKTSKLILDKKWDEVDLEYLRTHGEQNFIKAYEKAREEDSIETELKIEKFPTSPPFSFQQAINEKYFPE